MYETYRMLGKEHDAQLEREALKLGRATEARGQQDAAEPALPVCRRRPRSVRLRMFAFLRRPARAEG